MNLNQITNEFFALKGGISFSRVNRNEKFLWYVDRNYVAQV